VSTYLRKALEARPSPETERHIKGLLDKLEGIELEHIKIPKSVTVLEVSDLLASAHEDLKSKDATVRGMAAHSLGGLDAFGIEVTPEPRGLLKTNKHEYVRRSVASALAWFGKRSAAALPNLREGLKDTDVNIRSSFEQAVKTIEEAKEEPDRQEHVKKMKA